MTDREILEQAHAKIQQKQYHDAERLLRQIPNNPTAAKWLGKIEEIVASQVAPQASVKASLPRSTAAATRKPLPDVDLDSLIPAKKAAATSSSSSPKILSVLYATVVIAGVMFLLIAVAGETFLDIFNPLQTYTDSRIAISHAAEWEQQAFETHGYCRVTYSECVYFVKTTPNVGLLVSYYPLSNYKSAAEFAEDSWQDDIGDTVFVQTNRSLQDTTVGGFPAVAQFYSQSEKDENGGEFYMADIYVADGLDGYIINIYANTACNLSRRMGDINGVLSTLRFTSTNVAVEGDGYTPASPVTLSVPGCA